MPTNPEIKFEPPKQKQKTIVCAAIKRSDGIILAGRNHGYIIQHSPYGTCKASSIRGFLTSEGEFVGRSAAANIAFDSGQIKKPTNQLFSEDITQDNPWAGEIIESQEKRIILLEQVIVEQLKNTVKQALICITSPKIQISNPKERLDEINRLFLELKHAI